MKISEYINDLLLFNNRLTLPGLGTFEILREPAVLEDMKISPPKSFIVFNPDIQATDNTLAMKIADIEEIEPNEAEKLIFDFIKEIQNTLDKNEIANIEGLGTLQRDEYNNYIFIADEKIKLDFEISGFEAFELDLSEEQADEQQHNSPEQQLTDKPETEKRSSPDPIKSEEERITGKKQFFPSEYDLIKEKKSNRNFIWILSGSVVVILIAVVILALTTDLFDDLNTGLMKKPIKAEDSSTSSFISKNQEEYEKSMESTIDSLTKLEHALRIENDQPFDTPLNLTYSEYHIIAGSFSVMENADDMQKELSLNGYPSVIIDRGDGFYRVSALSFKDKEQALEQLETFKNNTVYKSAWVLGLK